MKVCLMSDSHGNLDAMKKVIEREQPDRVLHAGDCAADVIQLIEKNRIDKTSVQIAYVVGNCDIPGVAEREQIVPLFDIKVFLTHGHRYRVKEGYLNLRYRADEVQANLIVFGHTHVPAAFVEQGMLFINPGSLSLPRGYRTPTYTVFETPTPIAKSHQISKATSIVPLQITFKTVEHGNPCVDLSTQVLWNFEQHQFSY